MVQSPSWNANWFEDSQEIPSISWKPNFHYVPLSVRHLYLSCVRPIHSIYTHPTSCRSVRILSTHVRLGLPSVLFPSGFITKRLYAHSTHPFKSHSQPFIFVSTLPPAQYWVRCTKHLGLLLTNNLLFPRYLVPPRSKYSPQHHILKHLQLPFLPYFQRPSFRPIQNQSKIILLYT